MSADCTARRRDALAIWKAGVDAVQPGVFMSRTVRVAEGRLWLADQAVPLDALDSLVVVGAGKAGSAMARALEQALGPDWMAAKRVRGLVNVIDDFADQTRPGIRFHAARSAGIPLPTEAGVAGSAAMLNLVASLGPRDLVIGLFSGGASALLPLPVPGVTLAEKRDATALLSKAGAAIGELNAVRKHLSRVKGGRLAAASRAGRWISLILSDVIGNPVDVIASGPTSPDPATYADALAVIRRFKLEERMPASVMHHLVRGRNGEEPETPKTLPPCIINRIAADNGLALRAAADEARARGYEVTRLADPIQGESREVGAALVRRLAAERQPDGRPRCLLAGGEPVVSRVAPGGRGGRCQELALGAYAADDAWRGCLLAAGTDGEDGPTDAAGAFCDESVRQAARAKGLDPLPYLLSSRSYDFFAQTGGLLKTGPTGTNVMDLVVALG